MAIPHHLSVVLRMLLTFSLLLPTGTAQHGEASDCYHYSVSSITSRHAEVGPEVSLSKSMGRLNSDLESEAGTMRQKDSFPDKLISHDTHGRALLAENLVKDLESVTRRAVNNFDAEAGRQTSSNWATQSQQLCEYTLYIQTGNQDGAGTDSDIRLLFSNTSGDQVYFKNIQNGHRTFEKGHTDTFVFRDQPCITQICQLVVYTDDYGPFSEWFVVSVSFKAAILDPQTGVPVRILQEKDWVVNSWLPREDASEELYIIVDDCDSTIQ